MLIMSINWDKIERAVSRKDILKDLEISQENAGGGGLHVFRKDLINIYNIFTFLFSGTE